LLVEDHSMVRQGLRALIALDAQIVTVGEASNGKDAVALTEKLKPDVVMMDVAMPGLNGFEATRQILEANPKSKIVVLSAHGDDEYVTRMIQLGVDGLSGQTKLDRFALTRNSRSFEREDVFFTRYCKAANLYGTFGKRKRCFTWKSHTASHSTGG
jgi:CheY-like chemotaxis protein